MTTIIDQLATFAVDCRKADLPERVRSESRRILLDTIGCAVASTADDAAQRGVAYARTLGDGGPATIMGTSHTTSLAGAAFANAELTNALDQDAVLPPGHVTPYVVPGTLAAAEAGHATGEQLLRALAVAHEMSFRIGKATDYLRDIVDGVVTIPKIIGYSSTLFGGTAGLGMIKGFDVETMGDALGIMGSTMPSNTQRAWMMHAPATTIKYQLAGALAMSTVTAAAMAEFGHTGDREMLDDREFGFPRFIGTQRWEPAPITHGLGDEWLFTDFQAFKPYPHCRVMHGLFDALIDIVTENDIAPSEIESIDAWGESFVMQPVWVNETIRNPRDAQFSMTHGLALAAHRFPPGVAWQTNDAVHDQSVLELMERTSFHAHPGFAEALAADPSARTTRLELRARGTTYSGDRQYPKGVPSPDSATYMTDDELAAKFRHNVEGVLSAEHANTLVDMVFGLDDVHDVADLMRCTRAD